MQSVRVAARPGGQRNGRLNSLIEPVHRAVSRGVAYDRAPSRSRGTRGAGYAHHLNLKVVV